jgi:hypothetical protein
MQKIADLMSQRGIPVNVDRFRAGFDKALDSISEGDPIRLRQTEARFKNLSAGFDGHLYPNWHIVTRGEEVGNPLNSLDWSSSQPNVGNMPYELLKAVKGVYIYHDQPTLYFLGVLGSNQEWVQHYEQGGSLWDKVQEWLGRTGPISSDTKRRFYHAITLRARRGSPVQDLVDKAFSFSDGDTLRTIQGSAIPTPSNRNPLWAACVASAKESVREGVLVGFQESDAPLLIYHDGVVVDEEDVQAYSAALSRDGLRIIVENFETGVKTTRRRAIEPKPKLSRFDFIK